MRHRYGLPALIQDAVDMVDDFFPRTMAEDFFGADFRTALKGKTKEEDNSYVTTLEVPGLPEDAIDIQYKDGHLVVHAEWKEENKSSLRAGKYCYNIYIPDVDVENIEAKLNGGMLTVTSPKKEGSKSSTIKIKTE